jgi:predicted small lipoprotein YifL
MSIRYLKLLSLLLLLAGAQAGCGQTGPLYLPEKTAPPPDSDVPAPQDEPPEESPE